MKCSPLVRSPTSLLGYRKSPLTRAQIPLKCGFMKIGRGRYLWQRVWAMRDTHNRLLIIAGVLTVCCAASNAQTFYKWTDERGVVHLADEPPPDARGVEERHLPAPPIPPPAPADEGEEAKAAPAEASAKKGRAQVILLTHQAIRNGPNAAHVVGEVKNIGGENAATVEVMISAVDVTQGTPCLSEQAAVNPSTLAPGETGNFDVDLDSPCLAGGTPVNIAPVWR